MAQANPIVLIMGVGAFVQVGVIVSTANLPTWARYGGAGLSVSLAAGCLGLAVASFLRKKPAPPPKRIPRRRLNGGEAADSGARPASGADRSSRADS
jgi:hypothetical protein